MIQAWASLLFLSCCAVAQPQLPDGPGKKTVEKLCFTCHGPENVLKKRHTKPQWDKILDTMSINGAKGTEAEFDAILNYLARYFGQVNVNKASATEMQDVLDISAEEAGAIVKYREANGDFKSVEDVGKAPGLDAKKIGERKDRILLK